MKKGKAVQLTMSLFDKQAEASNVNFSNRKLISQLEKGLMRGLDDTLAVMQMLGNVKVQGQGVQKLKTTQKASNKQKKQQLDKDMEEAGLTVKAPAKKKEPVVAKGAKKPKK